MQTINRTAFLRCLRKSGYSTLLTFTATGPAIIVSGTGAPVPVPVPVPVRLQDDHGPALMGFYGTLARQGLHHEGQA